MDSVLISFIVPCYNVECYVQQCLDSIYDCGLSENDFEVICINDCSPDRVQIILEQNSERHGNFRVIVHEKNKGLGGARNTGIREAKGKYLWFVDSDDLVTVHNLSSLMQRVMDQDLDVLCFNYRRVDEKMSVLSEHVVFDESSIQDGYSFVKTIFGKDIIYHMGVIVRFLYRVEYLRSHQLYFPEKVGWEDTVYMPKSILQAGRVASIADILYSYRENTNSITNSFYRAYPAKLVFEYAFCTGGDLLNFSEEIKDEGLREAIRTTAIQKYINGFPIYLFRTSKTERKKFYVLTREKVSEVKPLKCEMNMIGRLLLIPLLGFVLSEMGALIYGAGHRKQKNV